jgi:hypothetical protein
MTIAKADHRKSTANIKRSVRALRAIIENPDTDRTEVRIAQAVEEAMRWASERTHGWKRPEYEIAGWAEILRADKK